MKLISWNVNGLRAVYKQGYWEPFLALKPDIFGLQEIKAEEDQLPDEVRSPKGYHAYFNSSKTRKGYSGVALYSKEEPFEVFTDLGIPELDQEGRLIGAEFKDFYVFNVYFPNGGGGEERLAYKLDFYDAFLEFVEKKRSVKPVIFMGDVNTAHEAIDLARPKANEENTGFLPEERAWVDEVVNAGYIDTFRHFFPTKEGAYSYWDMKTRARDRNVGWRIDYVFASRELHKKLKSADIHTNVFGSDHCPISLILS
tara:strand:- start:17939 stop:18703 length:765 start_codon:yes stop_codon:yes gene_type:complete